MKGRKLRDIPACEQCEIVRRVSAGADYRVVAVEHQTHPREVMALICREEGAKDGERGTVGGLRAWLRWAFALPWATIAEGTHCAVSSAQSTADNFRDTQLIGTLAEMDEWEFPWAERAAVVLGLDTLGE